MNSQNLRSALLFSSAVMVCGAAILWSAKSRNSEARANRETPAKFVRIDAEEEKSRRASALLEQSTRADNELSYSALSRTVALVGGKSVTSEAKITRAPRHLSIEVTSGPQKGARSGYSQRWFWRRDAGRALQPYAEVARTADQMAARRARLLAKNYTTTLGESQNVAGRAAQVLELRPRYPLDGATGPARRLLIDRESGLTLEIESFNCDLKPISRSSLSDLNLKPQITPVTFETPKAIFASLAGRDWQGEELGDDSRNAAKKTGFRAPKPTFLPPGFELDGYGVHRCRTTGVLQLAAFSRYTDGLNTLTIFAFKPVNANIQKNMRGFCDFGAGTLSSVENNGGRLVALGDLRSKTLQRVLASTKFEMAN